MTVNFRNLNMPLYPLELIKTIFLIRAFTWIAVIKTEIECKFYNSLKLRLVKMISLAICVLHAVLLKKWAPLNVITLG
jgi:hypothetical protein